jgi:hypothetical protein
MTTPIISDEIVEKAARAACRADSAGSGSLCQPLENYIDSCWRDYADNARAALAAALPDLVAAENEACARAIFTVPLDTIPLFAQMKMDMADAIRARHRPTRGDEK